MKNTIKYEGFSSPSSCEYSIGQIDGKIVVIFIQGALTNTSITNVIEVLSTKVLCEDLAGTDPFNVRFFEFYPPNLDPIKDWQEVVFENYTPITEQSSFLEKLLIAAGIRVADKKGFTVDRPAWNPVSKSLVSKLIQLV